MLAGLNSPSAQSNHTYFTLVCVPGKFICPATAPKYFVNKGRVDDSQLPIEALYGMFPNVFVTVSLKSL
ncbi:hypothetical protein D3C81_1580970 [compost metagenome]